MKLRNLSRSTLRVLSGCCVLAATSFVVDAQSLTFTTFAGTAGGAGSADGTGSEARFYTPSGVATDGGGNVYVADSYNGVIRKITPAGVVTTVAGTAGLYGSADGTSSAARFSQFEGVAADSGGNVYVADSGTHTIRKITPARVVTTVAGSPGLSGSAEGTGNTARFNSPRGLAIDSAGNIIVADTANSTIRMITPAGVVTTLAGSPGIFSSEDGTGSAARFSGPAGVAIDRDGNIYVADASNNTIRKITSAGVVTTFAGSAGIQGTANGTGSAARFNFPAGVATDSGGNVYVADRDTIRKITPAALVTTLAGSPGASGDADGATSTARFSSPRGVATDSGGNIYVADQGNHSIRKVTPVGVVTTLAGSPARRGIADGTANAALFFLPWGLATDSVGNIYVADRDASTIRKISSAGVVTTLAGSPNLAGSVDGAGSAARFRLPTGVATDGGGGVYVADSANHTIRRVTAAGMVTTLAGAAGLAGSDDGTGTAARFNNPEGMATDGDGNLYVADVFNKTIRKITAAGVVTTLAGSAGLTGNANGTGSAARFDSPRDVATDSGGNVYVADTGNRAVRKVTPAGVVTTLFTLSGINAVATDGDGNIYAASNIIRKVTPAGVATTLAGSADLQASGTEDGTGAAARFRSLRAVKTDGSGNVYVSELLDYKIRVGRPALDDAATIDAPSGMTRVARQLDASPQTATSWQWRIIRQPSGSTAALSSTSIRNPVFTPDVADLYVFQLTASDGVKTSITTVSLTSTPAPPRHRAVRH